MDVVEVLEELVSIPSVNPAMGGEGEGNIAASLARLLGDLGLAVAVNEVEPGRPNILATLPGRADVAVLLQAHLDTVAPFLRVRRDRDRLVGRGACDTKGSAAAMVGALHELSKDGPERPTVIFAGTIDEEVGMVGSRALLQQLPPVQGAVVGEPTSLSPVRVHNGLARFRVIANGRAAHSSRADLGINAISAAARAVVALEGLIPRLRLRAHPLAGPALLTVGVIRGGSAPNVVPDRCEVLFDRRLAPGERPEDAMAEIDEILSHVQERGDLVHREAPYILLPAVETPADHPLVEAAEGAVRDVLGRTEIAGGAPYGTDASNLAGLGGIPCVVLGPGSIDVAHSSDEWVRIHEVQQAVTLYAEVVRRFARAAAAPVPTEERR
ncbi:MAG TPA: M20/M25/M40 family metallo-hydrolase [Actinomycetota bacterium]|nr:M20/M25/M40 family metallo-hydrolase [Actinomycetota bacterium]